MDRPKEIRAAPREWLTLLQVTYRFLREQRIGDLLLYGSQSMSLYMRNPLRSKDLDLLSGQVGMRHMEALADKLSQVRDVECRTTTVQTKRFDDRKMTTYSIELRIGRKPFFIELFDSILDGRPLSILQPYVEPVSRWGLEIWSPGREATVALRLAFRQPEGITRLNAIRLNRFIHENLRSLDFNLIALILKEWNVEEWVERNLIELYRRNRIRIVNDRKIVDDIDGKIKPRT
ncbi:hypothetical protein KEJ39_03605 [Candidatus Bathyarchaeota archaeon]|nr:hypothetical protein [Candidatus Bathyarchaeota archaeon]